MPDDYWQEHREHQQDVRFGVVRCNDCGSHMKPHPRKDGKHWCETCGRTIRSPRWFLEEKR
jgi:ribosomal protein S27E